MTKFIVVIDNFSTSQADMEKLVRDYVKTFVFDIPAFSVTKLDDSELDTLLEIYNAATELLTIREEQVGELLTELAVLRAERLLISKAIKAETDSGDVPDNLAECVEYLMIQEYYPAQKELERLRARVKGLESECDPQDKNCPNCKNGGPIYRDGMCLECYTARAPA